MADRKATFLGYEFGVRGALGTDGRIFDGFLPALSRDAAKQIRQTIRGWRLGRRSSGTLRDLAHSINAVVRGWINYYGRFYASELYRQLNMINVHLVRWAMQKYKRLRRRRLRAWEFLAGVAGRDPSLFAHWQAGPRPGGRVAGAG